MTTAQPQKLTKTYTTERPFSVEINLGTTTEQQPGESREHYCRKAANFARKILNSLRSTEPDYKCAHYSFAVRDAMLAAEAKFVDLGTFGVEHIAKGHTQRSPSIEYLNAGDTYAVTVLYIRGTFRVGCWGDIVERGRYD